MNPQFNYKRLLEITKTQKPYRKSENRYPFAERRYGYKHFFKQEVNGIPEFVLCYGYDNYGGIERTKFAVVRSDNSIEFIREENQMYQGLRMIMSAFHYRNGYFRSSIKHGGIIYNKLIDEDEDIWRIIPIFKGLRMNMDTLEIHDSCKYTFTKKTINREKSKNYLAKYDEPFKIAEVLFSNMSLDTLYNDCVDIVEEHFPDYVRKYENNSYKYVSEPPNDKMFEKASEILNTSPLDAYVLMIMKLGQWWRIQDRSSAKETFRNGKNRIFKNLKRYEDIFDVKEYDHTQDLTSSEWGVDVLVNNQLVDRYL